MKMYGRAAIILIFYANLIKSWKQRLGYTERFTTYADLLKWGFNLEQKESTESKKVKKYKLGRKLVFYKNKYV